MNRKVTVAGMISLLVVALAILLNMLLGKPASFSGTLYGEPYPPLYSFQLTDADGRQVNLSDFRGKIVLLFFGFTYCPDVCPTTLAELKLVMKDLDEKSDQVQVLFISVDPKRDTSESMQAYVDRFDPSFIGLSGTQEQLEPIWKNYGIFREVVEGSSENNYTVNHTARILLIDQDGNLRLSYDIQVDPEDISRDIQILLRQ
jgi:protein SCO1